MGSSFRSQRRSVGHYLGSLLFLAGTSALAQPEAVPGEYIVKFKRSTSVPSQRIMEANLGARTTEGLDSIGAEVLTATQDDIDHEYAKKLLASGAVEYLEPNYIYRVSATPDDSQFDELWGLHNEGQTGGISDVDIDAPEAWDLTTGSDTVVVGVVDTGVNHAHPDLAQNMWVNSGEIAGNGVDDDNSGVVDDIHGYNAIAESGEPMDDHGHGSHSAGTIGGAGDNGIGVAGVNWNVKIMALKFLDASGSGTTDGAIRAIEYAVRMKQRGVNIRVLSNSWGGGGESQALSSAISAAEAAGILFVAAAGNSASDNDVTPTYPANYPQPSLISVAAIDSSGNLASFSNYGATTVDIAAPGVSILSTVLGSGYSRYSGTSMATPHVSGVAALLLALEPNLTPEQLRFRLVTTVAPLQTLRGLTLSAGNLNARNALTNTVAPAPPPQAAIRYTSVGTTANFDSTLGTSVLKVDDGFIDQTLPFDFEFYGTVYRRVGISANGRIVPLGADEELPSPADYSNRLFPGINIYNDDLYPSPLTDDGGLWFKSDASGATITWVVTSYAQRTSSDDRAEIRIQARLRSDGKIEAHYLDTETGDVTSSAGASATIGLAPPSGVAGERLIVSNNTSAPQLVGSGRGLLFVENRRAKLDFDGDGASDLVTWRPQSGEWFMLLSRTAFDPNQIHRLQLGSRKDLPVTGDFDGDGVTDIGVFRPAKQVATWLIRLSQSGRMVKYQWGKKGDLPVTGDFDGDGRTDIAVFANGTYQVLRAASGFNTRLARKKNSAALLKVRAGGKGSLPVIGDFSGRSADAFGTVTLAEPRIWTARTSSGHQLFAAPWGNAGEKPLACDRDGNGVADRVMVASNGALVWNAATDSGGAVSTEFGSSGGVPFCDRDYDADGKADLSVYENGTWRILESSTGVTRSHSLGETGDSPQ